MGITKKLFTTIPLSQLMKRVPPEQMEQFEEFRNKCTAYQSEVDKYPDQLPRIDWNYYRANVSKNFVQSVEQFEIHYKELDFCFATRYDNLDFSQYYTDWEKVSADIKQRIDAFLTQSNNKIAIYQAEIRRLSEMTPYEDMTMEQFVVEREDIADLIPRNNLPLFWPFTEDEQKPGPALPGDVPSDEDQPDEKEGPEKPCPEKKNTAQEEAIKTDMITKQASEKDPVNKIEAEVDTSKSLTKGKKEKEKKHVQEEEQLPKMEMQPKAPIKAETKQITAGNSPEGKGKSTSEVPPSEPAPKDPAK